MRLGLSTLLLLVTIVALGTAIAVQDREPALVTIEQQNDIWMLNDEQLARSLWDDTSEVLPLSQSHALATANEIVEYLTRHEDQFRFRDLLLESVSLVRVENMQQSWAYQIFVSACTDGQRGSPELSFLLLMDGSIAMDPDEYWPALIKFMQDFDSEKELEIVGSMFE